MKEPNSRKHSPESGSLRYLYSGEEYSAVRLNMEVWILRYIYNNKCHLYVQRFTRVLNFCLSFLSLSQPLTRSDRYVRITNFVEVSSETNILRANSRRFLHHKRNARNERLTATEEKWFCSYHRFPKKCFDTTAKHIRGYGLRTKSWWESTKRELHLKFTIEV